MVDALTFLILIAPFAVAAALGWAAQRSNQLRFRIDEYPVAGPMLGRFCDHDRDAHRIDHELDAIRTRFEPQLFWPVRRTG